MNNDIINFVEEFKQLCNKYQCEIDGLGDQSYAIEIFIGDKVYYVTQKFDWKIEENKCEYE